MFWKRSDLEVVERPIQFNVEPQARADQSNDGFIRSDDDETCFVSWKSFARSEDVPSDFSKRGVFLIYGNNGQVVDIGCSDKHLHTYPWKRARQTFKLPSADIWLGEVSYNGQAARSSRVEDVRRALIFTNLTKDDHHYRKRLVVENVDAPAAATGPLLKEYATYPITKGKTKTIVRTVVRWAMWPAALVISLAIIAALVVQVFLHGFGPDHYSSELDQVAALSKSLQDALAKNKTLETAWNAALAEVGELKTKLDGAFARIKELEADNKRLIDLMNKGGAGIELSSCWQSATDKFVPVYRVEIRDADLVIRPAWKKPQPGKWPGEFDTVMSEFSQKPIVQEVHLSRADFGVKARPYYDYGVGERNCRFFVEITDRTTTKESWKSGLALVERYFYKRLVGTGTAA